MVWVCSTHGDKQGLVEIYHPGQKGSIEIGVDKRSWNLSTCSATVMF